MIPLAKSITKAVLRTVAPNTRWPYRVAAGLEVKVRRLHRQGRTLATNIYSRLSGAPDGLPLPPARLLFLVQGTKGVREFLTDGRATAREVMEVLETNGVAIAGLGRILDFGCGCGRVLRHFHGIPGVQLYGSDYNRELIDWCRRKLRFAQFEVNELAPPLAYEANYFDFIYALSVFTHLPESLQTAWMSELARVLKPGGYLLMTTHGECYLPHMSKEERQRFRAGQLVVRGGGTAGSNPFFAAHPPGYVETHLPAELEIMSFRPETRRRGEPPSRLCWQDGYLLVKRES